MTQLIALVELEKEVWKQVAKLRGFSFLKQSLSLYAKYQDQILKGIDKQMIEHVRNERKALAELEGVYGK